MEEILELASKLGKLMAADSRAKGMAAASKALAESTEDRQLLGDFEDQQHMLGQLEASGKPIEPDQKRKLADLHQKVIASPVIKNLLKAQADYIELMNAVSQRIEEETMGGHPESV